MNVHVARGTRSSSWHLWCSPWVITRQTATTKLQLRQSGGGCFTLPHPATYSDTRGGGGGSSTSRSRRCSTSSSSSWSSSSSICRPSQVHPSHGSDDGPPPPRLPVAGRLPSAHTAVIIGPASSPGETMIILTVLLSTGWDHCTGGKVSTSTLDQQGMFITERPQRQYRSPTTRNGGALI